MADLIDTISAEYDAAVQTWRARVAEFQAQMETFMSNQADAVALGFGEEWNQLYSRAAAIQSTLTGIADGLSSVYSWVKNVFGLAGLGVVPLVPVAIITGSIATLVYFINQLYQFNQKIAYAKSMNYTARETAEILDAGGIIGNSQSKSILATVLIGGAILYFVPRLMKGKF